MNIRFENLIQESFGWDTYNWGRAAKYWLKNGIDFKDKKVLELGAGSVNGGLSLLAASLGAKKVVCTDYDHIRPETMQIHKKFAYTDIISYEKVDALNIMLKETFDIVIFKSMFGGIIRDKGCEIGGKILNQISKVLKSKGKVCLIENLHSTSFHMLLRNYFGAARNKWKYFHLAEIKEMIISSKAFSIEIDKSFGFLGALGRTERQKKILGLIDSLLMERFVPYDKLYIYSGILEKRD